MFTGLIEDIADVVTVEACGDGVRLCLAPRRLVLDLKVGDSIALNGVCLTAVASKDHAFEVVAGLETLRCTTVGELRAGDAVHIERALAMGGRLGGHWVLGHVDAVGSIAVSQPGGSNHVVVVRFDPQWDALVIGKGSIAIDGISLTINELSGGSIAVALIPHTVEHTLLAKKPPGSQVNLEFDVIGKYAQRAVTLWKERT